VKQPAAAKTNSLFGSDDSSDIFSFTPKAKESTPDPKAETKVEKKAEPKTADLFGASSTSMFDPLGDSKQEQPKSEVN
jgi:hypothetical protein